MMCLEAVDLVHLTDTVAVIGTPNGFVRNALQERYANRACGGTADTVAMVIGCA